MPTTPIKATTLRDIAYIEEGGEGTERTLNEAHLQLDLGANTFSVVSELAAPPLSPVDEQSHLVVAGATGVFAGHVDEIARYSEVSARWLFVVMQPTVSAVVTIGVNGYKKRWNGTAWVASDLPFQLGSAAYVTTGITASATQTQGQGALTSEVNVISTVATTGDCVTLPIASAGAHCIVQHRATPGLLQVFPASGDAIDGLAVNASVYVQPGWTLVAWSQDGTTWNTYLVPGAMLADPAHAVLLVTGGAAAQTIDTTFTKITQFLTAGPSLYAAANATTDEITVTRDGRYLVTATLSISGTAGTTFTITPSINGTEETSGRVVHKLDASGSVVCVALTTILSLVATNAVSLEVKADGASKSFLVQEGTFGVARL